MICEVCSQPLAWDVTKAHGGKREVILWTKCPTCNPAGGWKASALEVIWPPLVPRAEEQPKT